MKYSGVVLLVVAFLTIEWTEYVDSAFTTTAASIALTTKTEQAQTYTPPKRGTPSRREGGSTR